jgi:hypothetical protein
MSAIDQLVTFLKGLLLLSLIGSCFGLAGERPNGPSLDVISSTNSCTIYNNLPETDIFNFHHTASSAKCARTKFERPHYHNSLAMAAATLDVEIIRTVALKTTVSQHERATQLARRPFTHVNINLDSPEMIRMAEQ